MGHIHTVGSYMNQSPSKIIGIHLNYRSRIAEFGLDPASVDVPSYFLKPPSALANDGAPIVCERGCTLLNYEGEIALVIGKQARRVAVGDAMEHVAGYAAANDFSVHDYRHADRGSMLRVKGQDGFCPVGPIADAHNVDPTELTVRTYVDGTQAQEGTTRDLLFSFAYLIADISRHITLETGDIILTGTPANSRPVAIGSTVTVEVNGISRVSNQVVGADWDLAPVGAQQDADSPSARDVAYARSLLKELR
jgi:5-oxopent-3-ene-1,2,5-tricarboxylate decarboxylase/2-hydroxyhepta-2,4-diene-1,7-dioate isomerase